jgi:hypothetical protein
LAGQGRQPLGLEKMLRIYFVRQWFNLSDPQAEDANRLPNPHSTSALRIRLSRSLQQIAHTHTDLCKASLAASSSLRERLPDRSVVVHDQRCKGGSPLFAQMSNLEDALLRTKASKELTVQMC